MRLRPFDEATAKGRAQERFRRAFWTALTSALAKGVSVLAMLITVPITLNYLGAERFGLWMTIASLAAFLGFADLGIGNGVLNMVSEAYGKNDDDTARRCSSNAFFLLSAGSLGLGFAFLLVYPHIPWAELLNVSSSIARREAGPAAAVFVVSTIVSVPLGVTPRLQMAYQEGYISSMWQGMSSIVGLAGLLVITKFDAGLPWLVLVFAGSPIVGNLLNAISLFGFERPSLTPRWPDVDRGVAKQLLYVGLLFLMLQLANAVIYYADNIIIARALGPEAVASYAVPAKVFAVVPMILYMVLAPLWPAYREANARGDDRWTHTTLVRAILLSLVVCVMSSLLLVTLGGRILSLWVGSEVAFSLSLMLGFAAWTTVSSVVTAMALFLNAVNKIRFQVVFVLVTAISSTLAKVALVRTVGLPAVIWSSVGAASLFMLIPYSFYLTRRFASQQVRPH